ncbi:MAG: hybrid sensor histidine kinase/response regulator [Verrucomicrobia bacterium]|nr:hybrid sensor histidine kinase/response regulator [Verrucomicrobiota bacterium]
MQLTASTLQVNQGTPPATRTAMEQRNAAKLKGRKILIVDDDRINIRILSSILQNEGFVITESDSGESALALYDEIKPDLVLMDVMLPGIDGFAVCRELRERHGDNAAPVIFITAKTESDDIVEGLAAGGVDYLPKPFRRKESLARIRTHLQNRILSEQQKALVEQLKAVNQAKNKLLGMAAHDLRNPLASIRGLAEFLCDGTVGQLTPDQHDLANTIFETSQSMLTLLNELLDVATIEAGELKLHKEPHNLSELLEKAVYLNNINAARKNTKIHYSPPEEAPIVRIDPAKIKQVIDNLLSNAVKYSPPGSNVNVRISGYHPAFTVAVQDQGPGIPENERHQLFKDFMTLSAKPTGGEKATGLGLAICRKIVEAHRGAITATNLPQGGCEFSVMLPA